MMTIAMLLAAAIVLFKTIDVCATIDVRNFDGHPAHFMAMALYWALFGAGSVAVLFDIDGGGAMLLFGVAISLLDNRRRINHE